MDGLRTHLRDFLGRRPLLAAIWLLLLVVAAAQTVRIGVFMFDPARTQHAVLAENPFFRSHWCGSAYVRAAELAVAGDPDLYAASHYGPKGKPAFVKGRERALALLVLDRYEYPPPFLLLPRLGLLFSDDPLKLRLAWFLLEVLALAGGYLIVAAWVGGRAGLGLVLLFPAFWLSMPVLAGLQMGNFHVVMVVLCLLAMMAFARGRDVAGGAMLACAVAAKLSPGLLVVYLAGQRRWRAVAWTAAFGTVLVALGMLVFGAQPYRAFLGDHLRELASGEAFAFIFDPAAMAARPGPVAGNLSLFGLVYKLRLLGLPGMTPTVARVVAAVYLVGIVALAVWLGRRSPPRPLDRHRDLLVWLGLISLAGWQAPFIPGNYGLLTAIWLLVALAAADRRPAVLALLGTAWILVWVRGYLYAVTGPLLFALGLGVQAVAFGLALWPLVQRLRQQPAIASPPGSWGTTESPARAR